MKADLINRCRLALLAGARAVSNTRYDERGYAEHYAQNLLPGLPLDLIARDFAQGAGRELDNKLRAAHSSAALVANAFGFWRAESAKLRIAGTTGFETLRFEAACPTGLGGTAPHLDLLATGAMPVAIESKCLEWMETKPAQFSESYDRLSASRGHSRWFAEIARLRANPTAYLHLDAAQLIKHALGLTACFRARPVLFVYLYWEPRNRADWPQCRLHRDETVHFAARMAGSSVRLVPLSYRELWAEWEENGEPAHLSTLRLRYGRDA